MTAVRREDGFTLVELIVTMAVLLVVLSATLTAFDAFGRQANANNQRGDAQDGARNVVDQIAGAIRNAVGAGTSPGLEQAGATNVVFQTVDTTQTPPGQNTADLMRVRYCLDYSTPTNEKLYRQTQRWTTATAPAIPSTAACSATATPWDTSTLVLDHLVNPLVAGTPTVFTYGPNGATQPSQIAQVDVTAYVDRDPNNNPPATVLASGVSLRNVNRAPVVSLVCTAQGGGTVLCDSLGTADPDGQPLTLSWSFGSTCASLATVANATSSQYSRGGLTPGASYCFGFTATDPGGQATSATKTVTVR